MKSKGHKIGYLNNKELKEDEEISPTFEETIVLWCLEKIDSRLPMHVSKTFGHQMTGNTTLKDLQVQIFQRIPSMIEDLNDAEANRASALNASVPIYETYQDSTLAAGRVQNTRTWKQKRKTFCRICKTAGRPPAVYESHFPSSCRLKGALLNSVLTEDSDHDDDNEHALDQNQ